MSKLFIFYYWVKDYTNPLNDISLKRDLTAQEALNLLNEDVNKIVVSFTKNFIIKLNQDQINALLSLRYNVGDLSKIGKINRNDPNDLGKLNLP